MLGGALVAGAAALSGCGFRPLYGRHGTDPAAVDLAAVRVDRISDRLGQILRNDLIERLTPLGEPADPRYRLSVRLREARTALAIQADSTITRFNLRIDVTFSLIDARSGKALYRGRTRAVGSYDAVRSDFATLTAEQDSARRTVREASEDIRGQLAAFFARRKAAAN